jgi:hypothetical protein
MVTGSALGHATPKGCQSMTIHDPETRHCVANATKNLYICKKILYTRVSLTGETNQLGENQMNKANTRELNKALAWIATGDASAIDIACRTLATIQRAGTASDTKTILAVIKENGLSHKFYTDNHCLVAY